MLWDRQAIFKSKGDKFVPLQNAGFEPGVPDTKSPTDWMLADKPTELSRIKLKTWTRQPVPMISEHSDLTPLSVDFRTWLWRYTYLLLLISMLWHRQAIFKSKGDKLCSSAECRIWTRGPRHQIASRLKARRPTDWAIEDQAKNLNSTARPYDQRAFSPLDPTVSWFSHLAPVIYIFVVVNFDALAQQASDIQIERRQVVFLCPGFEPGVPDTKSPADWMLADKPTELSRIKLKTWTGQPVPMISEHSAHLTPLSVDFRTWLRRYTYLLLLISMLWHRQSDIQIERRQVVFLCRMQDLNPGSQTPNRQQTECSLTNRLSYRGSS